MEEEKSIANFKVNGFKTISITFGLVIILSFLPSHLKRNACLPKWINKLHMSGRDKPMFRYNGDELRLAHVPGCKDDTLLSEALSQSVTRPNSGGFFLR